jgi:hypothetical protein
VRALDLRERAPVDDAPPDAAPQRRDGAERLALEQDAPAV